MVKFKILKIHSYRDSNRIILFYNKKINFNLKFKKRNLSISKFLYSNLIYLDTFKSVLNTNNTTYLCLSI